MPAEPRRDPDHRGQRGIHLVGLDRGEAHAMANPQAQDPLDEPRERPVLAEIAPVVSEIRAREDDLEKTRVQKTPRALEHLPMGKAPAPSAHVRDDAVRAEGIAPVLHLEKRPGAAGVPRGLRRERARGAPRTHRDEGARGRARPHGAQERVGVLPLGGPENRRHAGKRPYLLRGPLRVAAGHHDPGPRCYAVELPDELPGLLVRATRHRAGVDDQDLGACFALAGLGEPRAQEPRPEGRGVVLIQAAPQRPKRNPRSLGGPLGRCRDCFRHLDARIPSPGRLTPRPPPRPRPRPGTPLPIRRRGSA